MNSEEGMSELISCNHIALQNFLFLLPGISEQLSVMTQHHIFCENLKVLPLPLAGRGNQAQQTARHRVQTLSEPHALFVAKV